MNDFNKFINDMRRLHSMSQYEVNKGDADKFHPELYKKLLYINRNIQHILDMLPNLLRHDIDYFMERISDVAPLISSVNEELLLDLNYIEKLNHSIEYILDFFSDREAKIRDHNINDDSFFNIRHKPSQDTIDHYVYQLEDLNKEYKSAISQVEYMYDKAIELRNAHAHALESSTSTQLESKFKTRADDVRDYKNYWKKSVYITGAIAVLVTGTVIFAPYILQMFGVNFTEDSKIFSVILRSVIAVATYILLGFTISQYNKEREIEEAYRFKETIAFSTPNFRDLALKDDLKDRLLQESTAVIFNLPYESSNKIKANGKKKNEDINSILDLISKTQKIIQSGDKKG